jgi:hypothetical protein
VCSASSQGSYLAGPIASLDLFHYFLLVNLSLLQRVIDVSTRKQCVSIWELLSESSCRDKLEVILNMLCNARSTNPEV